MAANPTTILPQKNSLNDRSTIVSSDASSIYQPTKREGEVKGNDDTDCFDWYERWDYSHLAHSNFDTHY